MIELEDEFFGFGVNDDENGDEEFRPQKSYKTFSDIAKAIGGFEKWMELPPELKTVVVSHLDYLTRTRLSFCSKQDYEVVSSSPIQLRKVEIKDNGDDDYYISREPIENVSVRMEFEGEKKEDRKEIHLHFIKRENDTEIGWMGRPLRRRPTAKFIRLEGCDNYEEAVKFVEKWLKQSRYSVESLTVEMKNWPFEKSGIQLLPQCTKIRICNENENTLKWWLERVHPNLKSLELSNRYSETPLSSQFVSINHIKMCNRMYIWGYANFTDEQFLSMTAIRFSIESNTVTDKGINTFIRKWINGKVREDFIQFTVWMSRGNDKDEILKNVNFRPWDDDFEEEARGFCGDWARVMGRTDCNQINKGDNSGTSATINISDDSITFSVTGRRMEYNGQIYTDYGIP